MAQIPVQTPAGSQAQVDAHKVDADPHPGVGTAAGPHAGTHASGSTDPVTPGSIGAADAADVAGAVATHSAAGDPHAGYATDAEVALKASTSSLATVATSGLYTDLSGTVPTSALPALAINDTFPVTSQAAMLALTAQRGDVAIRSDLGKSFILSTDSPSTLAAWLELSATGQVTSVNGQQGVILLAKGDVGLGNVDNTSDAGKSISTSQQAALDAKQPLDSDLTAIAALAPADDALVQRKAGAWTARTLAQVRTDLRPPVVGLTDAAIIVVDATLGDSFDVTLGGNRTLGNPTGAANGQKLLFRIKQDTTGNRTLAFGTKYRFGIDIASVVLSTAAGKIDRVGVEYVSADDKFDVIALMRGY